MNKFKKRSILLLVRFILNVILEVIKLAVLRNKDMKLYLFNQIKINNFSEKVFIFSFPPYSLLPESLSMIQELPHP